MEQELAQFTAIYAQIVAYLVEYSLQIVGAVIVFLIGLFISRRVGALMLALCKRKNLDITLSRFFSSSARLTVVIATLIIVLRKNWHPDNALYSGDRRCRSRRWTCGAGATFKLQRGSEYHLHSAVCRRRHDKSERCMGHCRRGSPLTYRPHQRRWRDYHYPKQAHRWGDHP